MLSRIELTVSESPGIPTPCSARSRQLSRYAAIAFTCLRAASSLTGSPFLRAVATVMAGSALFWQDTHAEFLQKMASVRRRSGVVLSRAAPTDGAGLGVLA